eukprot:gene3579-6314_t
MSQEWTDVLCLGYVTRKPSEQEVKFILGVEQGDLVWIQSEQNGWYCCSIFPSMSDIQQHKKESQPHIEKKETTSKFKLQAGFISSEVLLPLVKRKTAKSDEKQVQMSGAELVKKLAEKIKRKSFKTYFNNYWTDIVTSDEKFKCYNVVQDWVKYYFMNSDRFDEDVFYRLVDIIENMIKEVSKPEMKQGVIDKLIDEGSNLIGSELLVYKSKTKERVDETNTKPFDLYKMFENRQQEKNVKDQKNKKKAQNKTNDAKSGDRGRGGLGRFRNPMDLDFKFLHRKEGQESDANLKVEDFSALSFESETHLLLELQKIEAKLDDPVLLLFSLYSENKKEDVSECYEVLLGANESLAKKASALFRDLEKKDYQESLYLLCRIYRIGKMVQEKKSKKTKEDEPFPTKRPIGVGLYELSAAVVGSLEQGSTIDGKMQVYGCKDESTFYKLPQTLLDLYKIELRKSVGLQELPNYPVDQEKFPSQIDFDFTLYEDKFEDVISKIGIVTTCQLKNFTEVIQPSFYRNDIYITLEDVSLKGATDGGFFKKDTYSRNLMVKVKVLVENEPTENGNNIKPSYFLPTCIFPAAGDGKSADDFYESTVHHHVVQPYFGDTIRFTIDPSILPYATLVFLFYHMSNKMTVENFKTFAPSAISYQKFMENDLLLSAKEYKCPVYKYEKGMEWKIVELDNDEERKIKLSIKNNLEIKSKVVSTVLTQQEQLKNLIDWDKMSTPVLSILNSYSKYPSEPSERFPFLKEIFNSLFSILEKKDDPEVAKKIFELLVDILVGIQAGRTVAYKPVVHDYVKNTMKSKSAWKSFTKLLNEYLNKGREAPQSILSNIMKCLHHILHIIVTSRSQYEMDMKPEDLQKDREEFQTSMKEINDSMCYIIGGTKPAHFKVKAQLLKFFGNSFDYFTDIFEPTECGIQIEKFLTAIPTPTHENPVRGLMESKINILDNIARGKPLEKNETRSLVLTKVIEEVIFHLSGGSDASTEKIRLGCVGVIGDLISTIHSYVSKDGLDENLMHSIVEVFSFVPDLNLAYKACSEEIETLQSKKQVDSKLKESLGINLKMSREIVACSVAYCVLINEEVLEIILTLPESKDIGMISIYTLLKILINNVGSITDEWIQYQGFVLNVIYEMFSKISEYILQNKLGNNFDYQVFNEFFRLQLSFVSSKELQSEEWPYLKYLRIIEKRGDYRAKSLQLTINTWKLMEKHQMDFVPRIIDSIIPLMTLIKNDKIISLIIDLYLLVLQRENIEKQSLSSCEGVTQRNIVTCGMDQETTAKFIELLHDRFEKDEHLNKAGDQIIKSLKSLLNYIKDVETYDDEDTKTDACVRVMNYFKKHNNEELYLSYAHKLSEIHLTFDNYIESALCLLLHAEKLSFESEKILPQFGSLDEQPEHERKETLFSQIISYFEKGQDWEHALILSKELQHYYETITFDYTKLCTLMQRMGDFFKSILLSKRFFPSYFFVGKYGKEFKPEERGEFIYRGAVLENHVDFKNRLLKLYPNAKSVDPKKINENWDEKEGQYLDVYTVFSATDSEFNNENPVLNRNTHPKISSYDTSSKVKMFTKERRYNTFKETYGKKPKNEYKHLFRETTYFCVEYDFPHIQRRQRIQKGIDITSTPLQNATRDIEDKVREITAAVIGHTLHEKLHLAEQTKDSKNPSKPDTNHMSMLLNGTIDAAVNGGITNYVKAFFSKKFIKNADEKTLQDLKRFQNALKDQVSILKEALVVWRRYQSGKALGLVDHLDKMAAQLQNQIGQILEDPLDQDSIVLSEEDLYDSDDEAIKEIEKKKKEDEEKAALKEEDKKLESKSQPIVGSPAKDQSELKSVSSNSKMNSSNTLDSIGGDPSVQRVDSMTDIGPPPSEDKKVVNDTTPTQRPTSDKSDSAKSNIKKRLSKSFLKPQDALRSSTTDVKSDVPSRDSKADDKKTGKRAGTLFGNMFGKK